MTKLPTYSCADFGGIRLTVRTHNALKRAGYKTLVGLIEGVKSQLITPDTISKFGIVSFNELVSVIGEYLNE